MTTIPKTARANQIAATIEAVAKYHNLDPTKVYQSFSCAHKPMRKARCIIWFHLKQCGMSINSIARIFRLGGDAVRNGINQGKMTFTEEDMILIKTLPKIETTLKIIPAEL